MNPSNTCGRCLRRLRSLQIGKLKKQGYTLSAAKQFNSTYASTSSPKEAYTSFPKVRHKSTVSSFRSQKHGPRKYEPPIQKTTSESVPQTRISSDTRLQSNNLFHSFSESPVPEMRRRAAFIRSHAYCPHPDHRRTRMPTSPSDPETRKEPSKAAGRPAALVQFECPDCGIPSYCSEEHWADDYESHMEICDTLRQINEDEHDLRSGRFFPEFEYPGPQMEEFLVNMSNWDTYLYSREYRAIDDERSLRQVTRMLTYPLTIGSILSELSPYTLSKDKRITYEGLRSLSALRYHLHQPKRGEDNTVSGLKVAPPPMRIFVIGARAESSLPRDVWEQLPLLFNQRASFHVILIGPESMANRDAEFPLPERSPSNPFGAIVEGGLGPHLKISTYCEYYQTLHQAQTFQPFDPYFDCFVLFHPGIGHPASANEWGGTIPQLLETKCPILCTGYTEWDMERDRKWVEDRVKGEMDILMTPGENKFRSLRWDLNDLDPTDVSCGNWGVWAFRGKRYEATTKDSI